MMYIQPEGQKVDQYLFAAPSIFCQKYCLFWIQSKVELFFFNYFFILFFLTLYTRNPFIYLYGPLLPDHRTPKVNSGSFHLKTVVTLANYFIRGPLKHSKGPELTKQRKHFPVERQRSRKASRPREYLAQSSVTLCKNILSRYFSSLFYPKQKMLWPPTSGKCHVVKPA